MDAIFYNVVTLREASHMWGVSRHQLMMSIYQGRLSARKSCGTWLVSVKSMLNLFGEPNHPLEDYE